MNQRGVNNFLDVLLNENLTVKSIGGNDIHRSVSSRRNLKAHSGKLVKASRSVPKAPPKFEKYPMTNIPIGLEEKKSKKKPNTTKVSSTLDIIEKLKQIEVKTENVSFLDQTNEEIDIAYQQLQEIQKLIARKVAEKQPQAEEKEDEEEKKHQKRALINTCNRQLERMQKKYLNKTKIQFKSLQDFENLIQSERKDSERVEKVPVKNQKQVEVLFSKSQKNSKMSSESLLLGNNYETVKQPEVVLTKKTLSMEAKNRNVTDVEERMKTLLNSEHYQHGNKTRYEIGDKVGRIRYLLKPEHHGEDTKRQKMKTEGTQMDLERRPTTTLEKGTGSKLSESPVKHVKFYHSKLEESILQRDFFPSSDDLLSTDDIDDNLDTYVRNKNNSLSGWRQLQEGGVQVGTSKKNDRHKSKAKVDGSTLTSNKDKSYLDGRKKLNLLLYGKKELTGDGGTTELADSVLKSAYLSKEFSILPKNDFSKVNKAKVEEKRSMQLLGSVIHKFRDQLHPRKLANLKGRDQKLYTTLNTTLRNTLFTEIQK